ncbi:hypothetical protein Gotur_020978 [Gossypium turneri]
MRNFCMWPLWVGDVFGPHTCKRIGGKVETQDAHIPYSIR